MRRLPREPAEDAAVPYGRGEPHERAQHAGGSALPDDADARLPESRRRARDDAAADDRRRDYFAPPPTSMLHTVPVTPQMRVWNCSDEPMWICCVPTITEVGVALPSPVIVT